MSKTEMIQYTEAKWYQIFFEKIKSFFSRKKGTDYESVSNSKSEVKPTFSNDFTESIQNNVRITEMQRKLKAGEIKIADLTNEDLKEMIELYKAQIIAQILAEEKAKEEAREQLKTNRVEYIQTKIKEHTYDGICFVPAELFELIASEDLQDLSGVEDLLRAFPINITYEYSTISHGLDEKFPNQYYVSRILDCEYGCEYATFSRDNDYEYNTYIDFV